MERRRKSWRNRGATSIKRFSLSTSQSFIRGRSKRRRRRGKKGKGKDGKGDGKSGKGDGKGRGGKSGKIIGAARAAPYL